MTIKYQCIVEAAKPFWPVDHFRLLKGLHVAIIINLWEQGEEPGAQSVGHIGGSSGLELAPGL